MADIFYGEEQCCAIYASGKNKNLQCNNKGYYISNDGKIFCGVHSKNINKKELPKNPQAGKNKVEKLISMKNINDCVADKNKKNNVEGNVVCLKLKMMKGVPTLEGYVNIFPNFKHGNRKDGIGLPKLSPMSLGPICHGQPDLPDCKNLENFHQGSKVFKDEIDDNGVIKQCFYDLQKQMFLDDTPHRHKEKSEKNNICMFWLWKSQENKEKRYSYIECRQFYCNYYERLVKKERDFERLVKMKKDGYNLAITGYDSRDIDSVSGKSLVEKIDNCYLDSSHPFGHELCLFTMLMVDEKDYPWRRYKTEEF